LERPDVLNPVLTYSIGNMLALPIWLLLAASLALPAWRERIWLITGRIVPALYAVCYIVLIAQSWGNTPGGGFGSVAEVRALFADDSALTAGWFHYLAFDLFVGTWIARNGIARGVPRLLILLCLPLTLMFGPVGLLLYLLIRLAFRPKETLE
jgi:hypothetical protein